MKQKLFLQVQRLLQKIQVQGDHNFTVNSTVLTECWSQYRVCDMFKDNLCQPEYKKEQFCQVSLEKDEYGKTNLV